MNSIYFEIVPLGSHSPLHSCSSTESPKQVCHSAGRLHVVVCFLLFQNCFHRGRFLAKGTEKNHKDSCQENRVVEERRNVVDAVSSCLMAGLTCMALFRSLSRILQ